MTITTCIFDAYGTLFDVAAAARRAGSEPGSDLGENWSAVAEDWRRKQLEYSWLRAAAGDHCDFWKVTCDALDWALEAAEMTDPALRDRLLALYRELDAYPEVPEMLKALKSNGKSTAILSNGSPDMLASAVASAGIADVLDDCLSVESVGVFKPSSRVYDMVGARFDCAKSEVLFVSSNGWDVAFAARYGFNTVWVNRAGIPIDRVGAQPGKILKDLVKIPDLAV